MPSFSRNEVVALALVASVALGFGGHTLPRYERLLGPVTDLERAGLLEALSRGGLSAHATADGGIEIQKGESRAAFAALARGPWND